MTVPRSSRTLAKGSVTAVPSSRVYVTSPSQAKPLEPHQVRIRRCRQEAIEAKKPLAAVRIASVPTTVGALPKRNCASGVRSCAKPAASRASITVNSCCHQAVSGSKGSIWPSLPSGSEFVLAQSLRPYRSHLCLYADDMTSVITRTSAMLPFTCEQAFDVAADIEHYPEFLKGWISARIQSRESNICCVDQVVGMGPLRLQFMSRAILHPPARIEVTSTQAPFRLFSLS